MAEVITGGCNTSETKLQQNVHTKENHRQRQKQQSNAALNQNSHSGSEAANKYKGKFCSYIIACLCSMNCDGWYSLLLSDWLTASTELMPSHIFRWEYFVR
jgi:hypothetical protein